MTLDRRSFFGHLFIGGAGAPVVASAGPASPVASSAGAPAGEPPVEVRYEITAQDPDTLRAFVEREVLPAIERAVQENRVINHRAIRSTVRQTLGL